MTPATAIPERPVLSPWLRLAVAILPVVLAMMIGTLSTGSNIEGWYATIRKPGFNPPNWVFPIVWPLFYATIAISLWRLLGARPGPDAPGSVRRGWQLGLAVFLVHISLNASWTPVFFAAHDLAGAVLVVLAELVTLLWTIRLSWRFDRIAAWLLVPYLAWLSFACVLTIAILRMN